MKKQLAMVIDSAACIDCKACQMSCKVENQVPAGQWRNWIKKSNGLEEKDARRQSAVLHFQPGNCMHCENATCLEACPTGATYKDAADGTVKVNEALCIGCGSCIPACPYDARYLNSEKKKVDKCDFCEQRRARGELPACVVTCPTKARSFGDILDPVSEVAQLLKKNKTVRVINPQSDTRPNIYYLSTTAPLNWPVPAKMPTAIDTWKILHPVLWGLVGLNALGVLVMLGKQLLLPESEADDAHQKNQREHIHE